MKRIIINYFVNVTKLTVARIIIIKLFAFVINLLYHFYYIYNIFIILMKFIFIFLTHFLQLNPTASISWSCIGK